jgi:hypothetical protein
MDPILISDPNTAPVKQIISGIKLLVKLFLAVSVEEKKSSEKHVILRPIGRGRHQKRYSVTFLSCSITLRHYGKKLSPFVVVPLGV